MSEIFSNKHSPGSIIVISSPSGGGKSSVCNGLIQQFSNIRYSISATTRQPRGNEVNNREYYFISTDEFRTRIAHGEFAEWAQVYDDYYGTYKHTLDEIINSGNHALLDIDVQGAQQIMQVYKNGIFIFIKPPSLSILEERLRKRKTESDERIAQRMETAKSELTLAEKYDYQVINNSLKDTINTIILYLKTRITLMEAV